MNKILDWIESALYVAFGALILSGFWALTNLPAAAVLRHWWVA